MSKRTLNILSWLTVVVVIIMTTSFVSYKRDEIVCQKINVNVSDSLLNRFVSDQDIILNIKTEDYKIFGEPVWDLNVAQIENKIKTFPYIQNAEVYSDCQGNLNIIIEQNRPIVRIKNDKGGEFYIDNTGKVLPLSRKFSSSVLIVNGAIVNGNLHAESCVQEFSNVRLKEIFALAKLIYDDNFWRMQIQQIYVNSRGEYELVPRVGAHIVLFGNFNDYEYKFVKLRAVYMQGFKSTGWNKYCIINLKFDNQVVCTRI